jgi:hypothetical protein
MIIMDMESTESSIKRKVLPPMSKTLAMHPRDQMRNKSVGRALKETAV